MNWVLMSCVSYLNNESKCARMPSRSKGTIMTGFLLRSLEVGRCLDWRVMNARGPAGGILFVWNKRFLELIEMELSAS